MTQSSKSRRKIAVLQLSRIGDVLMSLPVLESLSIQYPNAEISFFINAMFTDLLPYSPYYRQIPIDFNRWYGELAQSEGIQQALMTMDKELKPVIDGAFDLLINLSSQRMSAILAALVNAGERRGLVLSTDDTLVHTHSTLSLFSEMKTGRHLNWIHQVEIYLSAVSGGSPRPLPQTGDFLFGEGFSAWVESPIITEEYILIAPGASIPEKEVDPTVLAALCRAVCAHTDYRIVLTGTDKEAHRHRELQRSDPNRIFDYAGKTDAFKHLWNLIYHAECLICNDSGPMHMAALMDKKTIVFSNGSAFFPETMAYNNHVLFFSPHGDCYPCPWIGYPCEKNFACKAAFDIPSVTGQVLSEINNDIQAPPPSKRSGHNAYKTRITEKGLFFDPQENPALSMTELWGLVYQSFWKEKLFGCDACTLLLESFDRYDIRSSLLEDTFQPMQRFFEELDVFLDQLLGLFGDQLRQPEPDRLDRIAKGIDTIVTLSDRETCLTPLLHYYKTRYHSVIADSPGRILVQYHQMTARLKRDGRRFSELISVIKPNVDRKCISRSEPVHGQPGMHP